LGKLAVQSLSGHHLNQPNNRTANMQPIIEHPANPERLQAYQNKLTLPQQQRAAVARDVYNFSKKFSLSFKQRFKAINLAIAKLHDCKVSEAASIGCVIARIYAQNNQSQNKKPQVIIL
jgi:hypothetical protein